MFTYMKEPGVNSASRLSTEELIVADLLLHGFPMAKISQTLNLSSGTVKTRCLSIYKKLGVKSKNEMINEWNGSLLGNYTKA